MFRWKGNVLKNKRGFTLIEILVVIAISVVVAVLALQDKMRSIEEAQARAFGNELARFNNGVQSFVTENSAALLLLDPLGGGPTGVNAGTGAAWLKSAGCAAGADRAAGAGVAMGIPVTTDYLPCHFKDVATFNGVAWGSAPAVFPQAIAGVYFSIDQTAGTIEVFTRMPSLDTGGFARGDLAGLAVSAARGFTASSFTSGMGTTFGSYGVDDDVFSGIAGPFTNAQLAMITAVVDNSGGGGGAFLRIDGSNNMEADLSFNPANPAAARDIMNANDVNAEGDVTGSRFVDFNDASFVVDPDGASEMLDINVNQINDRNTAGRLLDLDGTSSVFRLDAVSELRAPIFIDTDAPATYFLDPSATSQISNMTVNMITDRNDPTFRLDMDGTSILNTIQASTFVDRDNVAFYVDPEGVSVMQDIRLASRGNELLSDLLPRYTHKDSRLIGNGGTIPIPACGAGTPKVFVIPQSVRMRFDSTATQTNFSAYAQVTGPNYTIRIYSITGAGLYSPNAQALASTYCMY